MASLTGSGGVILTLSLDGTGTVANRTLSAAVTLPSMTSAGVLVNAPIFTADVTLPSLIFSGTQLSGGVAVLYRSLPALTLEAYGNPGANLTLPALTIESTLLTGNALRLNRTLRALSLVGAFEGAQLLDANITLPRITSAGLVVHGTVIQTSATLRIPYLTADVAAGAIATVDVTLPMITLGGVQGVEGLGILDASLPGLQVVAFVENGATLDVTVWSLNTETFDVTDYDNYDFIAFCKIDGSYYGVKTDGIYLLEGALDVTDEISAYFVSGNTDFGSENMKRLDKAYVGYVSDGDLIMTVNGREYPLERNSDSDEIKESRVSPAKGVKSRYWNVGIQNVDGADFHINELGLLPRILERKT